MKWHLCDHEGRIVRSCNASRREEARFRLAPIEDGSFVVSDADHQTPGLKPLTDEEAKGVATKVMRKGGDPKKAQRQARWAAKRKDTRQSRTITGQQREAIRRGNTRRMLERMKERRLLTQRGQA